MAAKRGTKKKIKPPPPKKRLRKSWWVYLLRCADGTLYCGIARDVGMRVAAHNQSKSGARYTRSRRPVELIWCEKQTSQSKALKREYAIKQLKRSQKEALAANLSL